jgi:hypothetical protein
MVRCIPQRGFCAENIHGEIHSQSSRFGRDRDQAAGKWKQSADKIEQKYEILFLEEACDGEIRQSSGQKREERPAPGKARDTSFGKGRERREGDEPQASDCYWAF